MYVYMPDFHLLVVDTTKPWLKPWGISIAILFLYTIYLFLSDPNQYNSFEQNVWTNTEVFRVKFIAYL